MFDLNDRKYEHSYDENSAELQWLEDSANDLFSITVSAIGNLLWAAGAAVWYLIIFIGTLVSFIATAFEKK